jgi:SAM-dependent methyltransferase
MDPRYLDGRYADANPSWHREDAAHKAAAVAALLRDVGWIPASVTDVGCGTGDVLRALRPHLPAGARLVGVDPAAPFDVSDLDLRRGTVADAPPADLALCLDVAEHVIDPVGLLRALTHVAPRAVLRLPLDLSALDAIRPARMLAARARFGHLHAWTADLGLAVVAEAGWKPKLVRYDRAPLRISRWSSWFSDLVRSSAFRLDQARTASVLGGYSLLMAAETPQRTTSPR